MKKTDSEGETETEAAVCAVVLLTVVCNCKEPRNGREQWLAVSYYFCFFSGPRCAVVCSLRRCCHSTQLAAAAPLSSVCKRWTNDAAAGLDGPAVSLIKHCPLRLSTPWCHITHMEEPRWDPLSEWTT